MLDRLRALGELAENWDSYGARVPTERARARARRLCMIVAELKVPEPSVFPTPPGGVQLEWQNGAAGIEVAPTGSATAFKDEAEFDIEEQGEQAAVARVAS